MTPQSRRWGSLFVRMDSVLSEVAHRYAASLPPDVKVDLLAASQECRALSDQDALAAALAEQWWPNRRLGDLRQCDWMKVYERLERPS